MSTNRCGRVLRAGTTSPLPCSTAGYWPRRRSGRPVRPRSWSGRQPGLCRGLVREEGAEGIVLAAERYDGRDPVTLGVSRKTSLGDFVDLIVRLTGFKGGVHWDRSKPDGQPRRALDTNLARERFGFVAGTSLEDGLRRTIGWHECQRRST